MDRKTWIAVILCSLGLVGWQWFYGRKHSEEMARYRQAVEAARASAPQPSAAPGTAATGASSPSSPAGAAPAGTPAVPAAVASAPVAAPPTPEAPEQRETVKTGVAEYAFTTHGGGIAEIALPGYPSTGGPVRLNAGRPIPIGAVTFVQGHADLGAYEMTSDPEGMRFSRMYPDGLRVTKRYRTQGEGVSEYAVQIEVTFENTGTTTVERPFYNIHLGAAGPIHEMDQPRYIGLNWHRSDGKSKTVDASWFREARFLFLFPTRGPRSLYQEDVPGLQWAGLTNQYFVSFLTPEKPADTKMHAWTYDVAFPGAKRPFTAFEGAVGMPGFRLEPGATTTTKFQLYAGPKEHQRLAKLGAAQDEVLQYGMFKPFSLGLLWAMNTLKGWLGNYAVAIIVLTLVIKTLLYPLQSKANKSMRKMAALSPKMTELREKYKDDPTRMNQEVMKLYKDYGVNPFGGCLPMLVQIPIFFGFYSMLGTAVELRNSTFLWVQDLSQPDTVFHVLGFPINILPLVMAATMLWQMSLTPKTGDAVQQRIFMFMPLIFVVFCYNFASALALYWTVQNLFSVVQLYLTRNQPIPALTKVTPAPDPRARKGKARR
jgi:YidC/Oxa1 family membrane protein insertase